MRIVLITILHSIRRISTDIVSAAQVKISCHVLFPVAMVVEWQGVLWEFCLNCLR